MSWYMKAHLIKMKQEWRITYFHSTTHQAAEVAKEANAKRLLLTHISARYLGKATQELEKEAQEVFEIQKS